MSAESLAFIDKLKQTTAPKWMSFDDFIMYLYEHKGHAPIWGTIQTKGKVIPVDFIVTSYSEIVKKSQVVDLLLTCYPADSVQKTKFDINAMMFVPVDAPATDIKRMTYAGFSSFTRAFTSADARDSYIDELIFLDDMLGELAFDSHTRQINQFFNFFKPGPAQY